MALRRKRVQPVGKKASSPERQPQAPIPPDASDPFVHTIRQELATWRGRDDLLRSVLLLNLAYYAPGSRTDFVGKSAIVWRAEHDPLARRCDSLAEIQLETLGHVVSRFEELENKVQRHDNLLEHGIRPALGKLVAQFEGYWQRDALTPAASADYEWYIIARKAFEAAAKILDDFEELDARLGHYCKVIDRLERLLELARSMNNRYLRQAVLTLQDAIRGKYSEDWTFEQAETIKRAAERLQSVDWNIEAVRNLDKDLRKSGFETVPSDQFPSSRGETSSRQKAALS